MKPCHVILTKSSRSLCLSWPQKIRNFSHKKAEENPNPKRLKLTPVSAATANDLLSDVCHRQDVLSFLDDFQNNGSPFLFQTLSAQVL